MTNVVDPRAREVDARWLALADAGDAKGSWATAGAAFRDAVAPETWAEQLRAARAPLGPLTSRRVAVAQQLNGLPGAPPGEYVVLQHHAVYDGRKAVVETVTPQREDDGEAAAVGGDAWRVVGYFIR